MSKPNVVNYKSQSAVPHASTQKTGQHKANTDPSDIDKIDNYGDNTNAMAKDYKNLVKCVEYGSSDSGDFGFSDMASALETSESQSTKSTRYKSEGELRVEYFLGDLGSQYVAKPTIAQIPNFDKDFGKLPQDEDQLRSIRAIYVGRKNEIKALLKKLDNALSSKNAGQMSASELNTVEKQRDYLEKAVLKCDSEIDKVDNRIATAKNTPDMNS